MLTICLFSDLPENCGLGWLPEFLQPRQGFTAYADDLGDINQEFFFRQSNHWW